MIKNIFQFKNKFLEKLFTIFVLFALSFFIMSVTFIFSSSTWNMPMFLSYFKSIKLILMNLVPIFLFMSFVYIISNRLWVGFLSSWLLFVTMSIVNRFKLTFRDDPFSFIDIKLIKESMEMKGKYEIQLTRNMVILIVGLIIITVILKMFLNYKITSRKIRLYSLTFVCVLSIIIFGKPYFNYETYASVGDKSIINVWSQTQQFQSKGFVYPFIYSIQGAKDTELEGYDEDKAIEELNKYKYSDIPENKKINVIAVMLEAYNDFSKFDGVEFGIDPYENFHQIQKESLHGNLVTNIFAGGTIDTERAFATGFNTHPNYIKNTNSFVRYFKEQGYRTEAMHPIYGWFYNRRNVNEYLGFDSFDYYENKYQAIQEAFYEDMEFFDYIIKGYEDSKENNQPYFNLSVTYQNHGPYSNEKYSDNQFLAKKDHYDEGTYNIINNYLAGIYKTDSAIKKLVDYFRNEEEPTVVVFFGDHNPWLGEGATGYSMLDINLDFSSEEGFLNYYETPYIIWGNDAAKQVAGKDFSSEGKNISPNFLMPEIFQYFGWEGNEYMQFLTDFKANIDVVNQVYFKENGKYTSELSPENQKLYDDFRNMEYYYSRNFLQDKSKKDSN
ncbi:alkaline phosphatase family protein [Proteiniborus sp. MB09-C3]|uniref:LTA synthase family protein n=1 Tax=Proteiniborus sp. MB09-C3 TaxID=3050072 RepID=UPI002554F981|nr:alkaline phosphatase family protein [Proteiniborus sp. MB09-C3]WIV11828.1 sulfatase-like hydrolase/transferase [Proteiniborus sp. MB09-C3]